jgi:trans-2,3-dihydro-3-hydroxyanthranilate isomerase
MKLDYQVVDVFTRTALEGNALAVFTNAEALAAHTMQKIAKELNLAETTFLLPATAGGCDLRVRIFTPVKEMMFAGHPTIGSAYVARAWFCAARCNAVRVGRRGRPGCRPHRRNGGSAHLAAHSRDAQGRPAGSRRLRTGGGSWHERPARRCSLRDMVAGNPILFVAVRDEAAVDRAEADAAALKRLYASQPEPVCTFVFAPVPSGAYSRMFAPNLGVNEDAATGSATGPLAAYMIEYGLAPFAADGARFTSVQGVKMGRRSELFIRLLGERGRDGIEVGGYVTPIARATMTLNSSS